MKSDCHETRKVRRVTRSSFILNGSIFSSPKGELGQTTTFEILNDTYRNTENAIWFSIRSRFGPLIWLFLLLRSQFNTDEKIEQNIEAVFFGGDHRVRKFYQIFDSTPIWAVDSKFDHFKWDKIELTLPKNSNRVWNRFCFFGCKFLVIDG